MARRVTRAALRAVGDLLLRPPLDRLGVRAGLVPLASTGRDTLGSLEAAIGRRRPDSIAVVTVCTRPNLLGRVFARRYRRARIHVLDARPGARTAPVPHDRVTVYRTPTLDTVHRTLSALPPVAVLIDLVPAGRASRLRHLLFHLDAGGRYLIADAPARTGKGADVWSVLDRVIAAKADLAGSRALSWPVDDIARADAVGSVSSDGQVTTVAKIGRHALKLHDAEAEDVLLGRNGDAWGQCLETRDPVAVQARGTAEANLLQDSFVTKLDVPRLYLREYRDVVCAPRQLAVQGDLVLPVSFHHALRPRLQHRSTLQHPTGSHYVVLSEAIAGAQRLPGTYFHFDSEFPGHFGHVLTEDVAKLWGYDAARCRHPDLKVLVSTLTPGRGPSSVQREVLRAWGIPDADVVCIDKPVRVDLLVGATQMFYNGRYVHPDLEQTWDRLRDGLRSSPADRPTATARIFITRGADQLRRCTNGPELEALFAEHGFAVVRPDSLSFRDQVDLFGDAEVIAGYGGSGMFTSMFSERPGRRIVIASENYVARNEWTVAALRGDSYHHFVCPAAVHEVVDPARPHLKFHSPFAFDFDRDGEALRRLLKN